jgi:hypothetical protein
MIDKDLVRLLRTCAKHLDALEAEWAVAGATAMAVHGYARQTKDIDLFVADDVRDELLQQLKGEGIRIDEVMPPSHYSIEPKKNRDPEKRIDILFPALGIESLGLMAAERRKVAGLDVPVLQLQYIIALKLQTDPVYERDRYAKDAQDLRELRARGLVDALRVQTVLHDVRDQSALTRLQDLVHEARPEGEPSSPPPRRR